VAEFSHKAVTVALCDAESGLRVGHFGGNQSAWAALETWEARFPNCSPET
jgi:hypothetical protein